MDAADVDLSHGKLEEDHPVLAHRNPGAPPAGIITTRGAASAFFVNGTNRAMFRFTMMNHLCNDLPTHHGYDPPAGSHPPGRDAQPGRRQHLVPDQLHRLPQRHGPDGAGLRLLQLLVSGERSRRNRVAHRTDRVHRRADAAEVPHQQHQFPARVQHARTTAGTTAGAPDRIRSWVGARLLPGSGNGAKSLGQELESSQAFASCQVTRVFKTVCFRAPSSSEPT